MELRQARYYRHETLECVEFSGYLVDERGEVLDTRRGVERRVPDFMRNGYLRVSLCDPMGGLPRPVALHRLIASSWHGPPSCPADRARHIDGDRRNNRPANLAWESELADAGNAILTLLTARDGALLRRTVAALRRDGTFSDAEIAGAVLLTEDELRGLAG